MKVKTYSRYSRIWLTVFLVGVLCAGLPPTNAVAQEGDAGARLSVLESTPARTVVELTVPDYQLAQTDIEGRSYDLVQIAGTQQSQDAGRPQLPVIGTMIGMPSLSNLAVRVLDVDYYTETGLRVPAAMTPQVSGSGLSIEDGAEIREAYIEDAEVFTSSEFYPAMQVDLGASGLIREQAVTQLRFNPVQYNPVSGEARVYRRIVVEVVSELPVAAAAQQEEPVNPGFEGLLEHSLLNYGYLVRPPATLAPAGAPAPPAQAAAAAASVSLKLAVEADGIYKVTYAQLTGAGLDLSGVDPRKIQVKNRGVQVPILVRGEKDGKFDTDDYVLFYGQAVNDIYTIRNIYWLAVSDSAGLRMATRDGAPGAAQVAAEFPWTLHAEEDTAYWQAMPNGAGEDHWFWDTPLSPNSSGIEKSRTYTVTLDHISMTATSARLRVRLKGYTSLSHRTKIYLNNALVDDKTWNGQIIFDHDVAVPHNLLLNGGNTVKVETVDTGAAADQLLVNWIEIDYTDTYVAQADRLAFRPPASSLSPYRYRLSGFSAADIRVFDVTVPGTPVALVNAAISSAGGFSAEFQAAGSPDSRYVAAAGGGFRAPAAIEPDQASSWKSPVRGADYIIITHRDFLTATQTLAAHRQAQGLRTVNVPVDDLYDEFNDGIFNPSAVRDFLAYAYQSWQKPAPLYVLLIGDATLDYKTNRWKDTRNFVPSQLVETALVGQTVSDNWFAAVSGDDSLPDLFIGRLSAESLAEVATILEKIMGYDLGGATGAWNQRLLMVAGDDSVRFAETAEILVDKSPFYYSTDRVYQADYGTVSPASDIIASIDTGAAMVTYVGHGGVTGWGRSSSRMIFESEDVAALANGSRLPLVMVANCMNGYFAGSSDFISMAELLQRQVGGGAVGVFAPADLGSVTGHRALLGALFDAVFQDDLTSLGAATTAAKLASFPLGGYGPGLTQSYVLFGDPYTRLAMPTNYPYLVQTSPANNAQEVAIGEPIHITFSKPVVPASVTVTGPDVAALQFVPTWNARNTVLTLNHVNFTPGRAYSFTVLAKDKLGNSLGSGLVPATWSFTVTRLDQAITFAPLADKTIGTAPFALSATASSGLPVSFAGTTPAVCTVSGTTVTLVKIGECSITASQAGNSAYKPAPTVTQTFIVADLAKQNQTITFNALPDKKLGDPPFTLNATASSGLPVSYAGTTPAVCTVAGNTVTLVAVGQCTITAAQAGNATYNAARSVTQTFLVTNPAKQNQTISFGPLPDRTLGDPSFAIAATASSGLPVSFTTDTPAFCQVAGTTVTLPGAGECSITARQAGNGTFNPAPGVTQRFVISSPAKQNQTLTFGPLPNKTLGDPPFTLSATASSGLPVTFTSETPVVCTVAGNKVTLVAAGQCSILASQAGSAAFNAARSVTQTFQVSGGADTQLFLPTIRK